MWPEGLYTEIQKKSDLFPKFSCIDDIFNVEREEEKTISSFYALTYIDPQYML